MKKYDIKTRQGRARRLNKPFLFNPETLQPHTKDRCRLRKFRNNSQSPKELRRHSRQLRGSLSYIPLLQVFSVSHPK